PPANWSYWGVNLEKNVYVDEVSESIIINEQTTSLLFGECNQAMRTEPVEIFLAALFHSFHEVFPDRIVPAVFNEGHGREPWDESINVADTVGWFTTLVPLHVPVASMDIVDILRQTKDTRRRIPGRGLPYFSV